MPPPGIILPLAPVPFLVSFLPFALLEEGIVLKSRGASNFEEMSTEALRGLAGGRLGVPRMACACTTENGVVTGARVQHLGVVPMCQREMVQGETVQQTCPRPNQVADKYLQARGRGQ